jgi:hypothetical protein
MPRRFGNASAFIAVLELGCIAAAVIGTAMLSVPVALIVFGALGVLELEWIGRGMARETDDREPPS